MLTLHRNANTIVTDENFSVKLKWVNPACYFESVPGEVGLGLEISENEYTRAEFGNPERFEKYTAGQDRKFPGISIRKGGAVLMAGTLVITNANHGTYSAWLQSELGVLGTAQRDKFINEMEWTSGIAFENKASYDLEDGDQYSCIPVYNPAFWDGKGAEIDDPLIEDQKISYLTERFRALKIFRVNKLAEDLTVDATGIACVISPYLFLNYVVNELFRLNGFFIDQTNNPLAEPLFQLLVYNNFNIFSLAFTTEIKVETFFNQFTCEDEEVSVNEVINATWTIGNLAYADLIPKIPLKEFILGLQNFLNVVFHFQNDNTVKIIERNTIPDAAAYSLDQYFLGFWSLGERKDVTLKFIQEVDKNDELFSEDWHDLSDRRADFAAEVDNITTLKALPSPAFGELRMVRDENKIYEYKWHVFAATDINFGETQTDVLEWVVASIGPQPFFYGDSVKIEEIKSACSTLRFQNSLLQTKQQGNIASARSLWADYSLRLMLNDKAGLYQRLLDFDGSVGLFATRWEKWARFWKNRLPVEGEFMLPLNELHYVINHITQPYSTRSGKFIIEEMECDFKGSQMGLVKIKGYKLD